MSDNGNGDGKVYIDVGLVQDVVNKPFQAVITEAQQIAGDKKWSAEHKLERIKELYSSKATELKEDIGAEIDDLEKEISTLRLKARVAVPSVEQVAQLEHVRAVLQSRWQMMAFPAMLADWKQALAAGDLVSAQIYRDFAGPVFLQKLGGRSTELPSNIQALADDTTERLQPGTRAALRRAATLEMTLPIMKRALDNRLQELPRTRIDLKTGEVTNSAAAASRRMTRSMLQG